MREHIGIWLNYLEHADPFVGIPLTLIGLALMFMGWQFRLVAIPSIFALVGLIIGTISFEPISSKLLIGGLIGLALAASSHFYAKTAVSLLSGLCGAFILAGYLTTFENLRLPDIAHWGAAGFGFIACMALSFISHREMVITITSFVGALFLISGINAILPQAAPTFHGTVSSFLADYPAFLTPFLAGGPTLIGTLVQMANADKSDAGVG